MESRLRENRTRNERRESARYARWSHHVCISLLPSMSCPPRTTQSKSSFGSVGAGAELDTAGLVLGFHARGEGDGHEHLALVLYFVVGFMLTSRRCG